MCLPNPAASAACSAFPPAAKVPLKGVAAQRLAHPLDQASLTTSMFRGGTSSTSQTSTSGKPLSQSLATLSSSYFTAPVHGA